ncbi:MAG: hypothetical protein ACREFJ_11065 [Acetobacteraceae bacterium]
MVRIVLADPWLRSVFHHAAPRQVKRTLLAAGVVALLAGCAPYAANITPAPISDARYDGWGCGKLIKERAFVDDALTRVSAQEDRDANHDAWMVLLIGVPTSGGGVKGEVAELKGEQVALHEAMLDQDCLGSPSLPRLSDEQSQ